MPPPVLYSTNPFLKFLIQQKYRHDKHYVWCSEYFDSRAHPRYSSAALIPPSSDPVHIYRTLRADCDRSDRHSSKIAAVRAGLIALAIKWEAAHEITRDEREEITYLAEHATFTEWRPLVYIIPRSNIDPHRLQLVPLASRAGLGDEYII